MLAVTALYFTMPALVAAEERYYTPTRPPLGSFLKLSGAAIVAGVATAAMIAYLVTELTAGAAGVIRLALISFLYGVAVPFATALLMPLNRLVFDLPSVTGPGALSDRLVDVVYGTPLFAVTYGVRGISEGIVAGAVLFIGAWLALLGYRRGPPRTAPLRAFTSSLVVSVAIAYVVLFGPFQLFLYLVEQFAGR